jgi:GT2 family glycosyltransferase
LKTPSVAVVIVNFNSGGALTATLASLECGLSGLEWEAVVVDNASTDGSDRAAESNDPRIVLVRQATNPGFASGVNTGIAHTSAPFVLVLNPDCHLEEGAGGRLLGEIDRHDRCAVIGPRILDPEGTLQESARGDPNLMTGLFGRTSALSRIFPSLPVARRNLVSESPLPPGQSSRPVDWVSGACMLGRRRALDEVRGFDEGYFLYWEDADLCRRLRNAGWETRYMPSAVAVHAVGQSSRSAAAIANRAFHRSAYRYYTTHVISQRWHPGRPIAWILLTARSLLKQLSRPSASGRIRS